MATSQRHIRWFLFVFFYLLAATACAATQSRPTISGYAGLLPQGGRYAQALFPNPSDAATVFCKSINAGMYNGYTGVNVLNPIETRVHPTYVITCQYQDPPDAHGRRPAVRWLSDSTWQLRYQYACKKGTLTTANTCLVSSGRPPQQSCSNEQGNPIDVSVKQKIQRERDYDGPHGLQFTRQYNSAERVDNTFAKGWRHNFSKQIISSLAPNTLIGYRASVYILDDETHEWTGGGALDSPGSDAGQLEVLYLVRADGNYMYFSSSDHGLHWATDSDVNYRLEKVQIGSNPEQWRVTTPETDIEWYDVASGQLTSIEFRDGRWQHFSYSNESTPNDIAPRPGLLLKVEDNFARALQFTWWPDGSLARMIDPAGQEFVYNYDNKSRLTSVSYPDGLMRRYHYNEAGLSPYQHYLSDAKTYLTGISNEISLGVVVRHATFTYDAKGLPISTEYAGGVNKYAMDYASNTVTDPLGTQRIHQFINKDGMQLASSISKPSGAGCAASAASMAYDDDLNLSASTDYNGTTTRFSYYPGNLMKTSVEAAGTAQERTTTYAWHSVFRLPTRIAAPKLLIINEYDERGNLLSTSEQATLDETGAQGLTPSVTGPVRKTSSTWNSVGQMLTSTELRNGVEQTTSYRYNAINGNLESMTDAAQLTTYYSNYNAHGDVGRIEHINGTLTDLTWLPRRWLQLRTETLADNTSHTTRYEYDGRGLTTSVTRSQGGYEIFNYDDAGRLTNQADNFDNSIDYVLDPMGNRLLEQARDRNGNITRQVRYRYDALNRLQQTIYGQNGVIQDSPSSTVLQSNANPARIGYPVKMTVTVNGIAPSGEVVLMENGKNVAIQFLRGGSAPFELPNLSLGSHSFSAFYSGDDKNHPSHAAELVQTIQEGVATRITLQCPASTVVDSVLTCTAELTTAPAWVGQLSGQTIQLFDGATKVSSTTLQIASDGKSANGTFQITSHTVGVHALQARYAGDAIQLASESARFSHTVLGHAGQISTFTVGGRFERDLQYSICVGCAPFNRDQIQGNYQPQADDTSLADIARGLTESIRAAVLSNSRYRDYQFSNVGAEIQVTGPVGERFAASGYIPQTPVFYSTVTQEALAPRPGTRARYSFLLRRDRNEDFGAFTGIVNLIRYENTRRQVSYGASFGRENWPAGNISVPFTFNSAICEGLMQQNPGLLCVAGNDTNNDIYQVYTPIGETGWVLRTQLIGGQGHYQLLGTADIGAETTILTPQAQIIRVNVQGYNLVGTTYSVTLGDQTWHYTMQPGDTYISVLHGLKAQIQSPQYVAEVKRYEEYNEYYLSIASTTVLQPFTHSVAASTVPTWINTTLTQEAR